jgi:hypothetical protein
MQAEAMAYRTLPAFLELVQRSRGDGQNIQMRGILLTLPESEIPGGRWERELRGRFGSRILSHVIPFDEEVGKALQAHQIVSAAAPERPAARAYHGLVSSLELAAERRPKGEPTEAPLLAAAALFTPAVVGAQGPSFGLDLPEAPLGDTAEFQSPEEPTWRAEPPEDAEPTPEDLAEADQQTVVEHQELLPTPRSLPGHKGDWFTHPALPADETPLPALVPSSRLKPDAGRKATPPGPKQPGEERAFPSLAIVWVGLGAVAGVGLRFIKLPDLMLPVVVGVAVTAAVVLALRLLSAGAEAGGKKAPAEAAAAQGEAKGASPKRKSHERINPAAYRPSRLRPPREE